ncbi:hypothetical protein V2J09_007140 [Rumex salicifolius]
MKVHQHFAHAVWDSSDPNRTCNRPILPLAPKLHDTAVDLKSFIRPGGGGNKRDHSPHEAARVTWQQEGEGGAGMRWNPAPEQIGILERLYRGGMRTPKAEQIEHITAQLSKYGKIQGKNVFYWFQNHKARERQKLKRTIPYAASARSKEDLRREEQGLGKRKCTTTCAFDCLSPSPKSSTNQANLVDHEREQEMGHKKTLNLFPLQPEGINCNLSWGYDKETNSWFYGEREE